MSLCKLMSHSETRISQGNQVVVPAEVRRARKLKPGDILVWEVDGETIRVTPRRRVTVEDIIGMGRSGGDAVEAKRRIQRGEH